MYLRCGIIVIERSSESNTISIEGRRDGARSMLELVEPLLQRWTSAELVVCSAYVCNVKIIAVATKRDKILFIYYAVAVKNFNTNVRHKKFSDKRKV